jgi:chromosome segregation ATPase
MEQFHLNPTWAYVILTLGSFLFGSSGVLTYYLKNRFDQLKALHDMVKDLQSQNSDQAIQMGRLEGRITALTESSDVDKEKVRSLENEVHKYRGDSHMWRGEAQNYKLKWEESTLQVKALKEELLKYDAGKDGGGTSASTEEGTA